MSAVNHPEIAAFATDKVNLPHDTAVKYRSQVQGLRDRLEAKLKADPSFDLVKMLHSGSVAKGTALRNVNDLDVAVYVKAGSAPARLELTLEGDNVSARLVTSPPLTGTGSLTGRCVEGWCDLSGSLDGGFAVKFRGVLNARDFRGTYVATPPSGAVQYGRFELAPIAAPPATK